MVAFKDIDKIVVEEFYRIFPDAKSQIATSNQPKSEVGAWIRNLIEKQCTGITKKGHRCKIGFYPNLILPLDRHIDGISNRCGLHEENNCK